MTAARSYHQRMDAWTGAEPPDLQPDDSAPDDSAPDESAPGGSSSRAVSLAGLTVAGFTRRRAAWLAGVLVAAWIVVVFARQVGDASAKAAETVQARAANAEVAAEVAALQRELDLVQRPQYIEQQAHGIGLGSAKDHAFTLAPDAPPLASDAPGSASVRLGAPASIPSPLDTWLDLLFGPDPGS